MNGLSLIHCMRLVDGLRTLSEMPEEPLFKWRGSIGMSQRAPWLGGEGKEGHLVSV